MTNEAAGQGDGPKRLPGAANGKKAGDPRAERMGSEELLPLVYHELRALAASMLAGERERGGVAGGVTLQPTVLVHEAYLRLLGPDGGKVESTSPDWDGRRHFFGAAAIAMRRILIDRARHLKGLAGRVRGDGGASIEDRSLPNFSDEHATAQRAGSGGIGGAESMLHLDAAMDAMAVSDARRHEVVMLRFFAGLTVEQTAQVLSVSPATVKNDWSFARAWLLREIDRRSKESGSTEGSGL
jgi:RNA polymerase sigma factor (TIGR02999 family)